MTMSTLFELEHLNKKLITRQRRMLRQKIRMRNELEFLRRYRERMDTAMEDLAFALMDGDNTEPVTDVELVQEAIERIHRLKGLDK